MQERTDNLNEVNIKDIRILRRIAWLKQFYEDNLTTDKIEPYVKGDKDSQSKLETAPVSSFLLYDYNNESMDFQLEIFRDYLLAEFYIEAILSENIQALESPTPPRERAILFLDGLLDVLLSKLDIVQDSTIKRNLLKSFDFKEELIEDLDKITSEVMANQYSVSLVENDDIRRNEVRQAAKRIRKKAASTFTSKQSELAEPILYKWISTIILNKIGRRIRLQKEKVADLITVSGDIVPGYIKRLSNVDLSNTKLIDANLSEADLSGANLSGAKLDGADLSRTNLSAADLSNANLSGANLSNANLSGANLDSSVLIGAAYQANNLKCTDADFKDAIIEDENFIAQLRNNGANNIPAAVKTREELIERLKKKELSNAAVDDLVRRSSFHT